MVVRRAVLKAAYFVSKLTKYFLVAALVVVAVRQFVTAVLKFCEHWLTENVAPDKERFKLTGVTVRVAFA